VFWLGACLPVLNWLALLGAVHLEISAHSLTGPWIAALPAFAFAVGWNAPLEQLWRGLAVGLSLSSAVAVAQALGWDAIPSTEKPGGLLYNSAIQATAIALVIIALSCAKDWLYIPTMLPGLWLAHSRGGWLLLAVGTISAWGWRPVLLAVLAAGAVALTWPYPSDHERLLLWSAARAGLGWVGHGPGSFADLLFWYDGRLYYPGHAHNDYLQLAYELGILAIPVYAIYAAALAHTDLLYWSVFVGFAVAGLFFYPLYAPVPCFIGAALAGDALRPRRSSVLQAGAR
jgi:hypothetical protein